ncbi:hypothetical protein [Mucilaginibacter sp.]|uniref:hypothetical protein n=1 Tax=Mucilaginibacter sp. TaxID=1882438 RepID=UPI00284A9F01|nr:hypothetical protein [Mucilaginibacter sp.]MDR3697811.1 hypothetical protein [Mucilaginibacter sp.]
MDDTPLHIKQLQLAIWLAKSPEERLRLTLEDNDALFAFWDEIKKNNLQNKSGDQLNKPKKH